MQAVLGQAGIKIVSGHDILRIVNCHLREKELAMCQLVCGWSIWKVLCHGKMQSLSKSQVIRLIPQTTGGKRISVYCTINHDIPAAVIDTNGTAVEVVCVTGAASRPRTCPDRPGKLSRWQASMAQYLPSLCARALSRSRYKQFVIR